MAKSRERYEKRVSNPKTRFKYLPFGENIVKIYSVDPEIIGLQRLIVKKKENERKQNI